MSSLTLPKYSNWSMYLDDWAKEAGRPKLITLDFQKFGVAPLELVQDAQEIQHLSFGQDATPLHFGPHCLQHTLDNLRLLSLHVASPVSPQQDIFDLLTHSSFATLRNLCLPWCPSDLSAFSSLSTLELHDLTRTSFAELVRAFPTFPPNLVVLNLSSVIRNHSIDLDLLAHHLPPTVLSLHLPSKLGVTGLAHFVQKLPLSSNLRFFLTERPERGRSRFCAELGVARTACEERGIQFDMKVRLFRYSPAS
jgi:hypothetical protein